jgi:hypothetical protein
MTLNVKPSKVLRFCIGVSVSVPFCKCALRALYALANSNRSVPPLVIRVRNRSSGDFALSKQAAHLVHVEILALLRVEDTVTGMYVSKGHFSPLVIHQHLTVQSSTPLFL